MLCFFQWFVRRVSRKVGLLKRRAESCGQRRNQKLHAAVAKSTFWSENVQNTAASEHFLKFWCRKIARRCGEKRILKWKCTKHLSFGAIFEVLMSKNCTRLWRKAHFKMLKNCAGTLLEVLMSKNCTPEAHFQLKFWKNWGSGSTFCTPLWREAHFQLKISKKTEGPGALFEGPMWKNCMPLWREAYFQVGMLKKNWGSRSTFCRSIVEKLHAAVVRSSSCTWRWTKRVSSGRFLKFRCRKISQVVR